MMTSNFHLAIGIPCTFKDVPAPFFRSFAQLERPNFTMINADNGPIDTLRNDIVEKALAWGVTSLIVMDVDMCYHPLTIPKLLAHRLPIVGALCFRRYPPFDSLMLRKEGEGYISVDEWKEDELVEVDATGAGCLMYDMEVFRQMPAPWFKFRANPDGSTVGEDIGFCQELKNAGYQIFVDTSVPADHLTTMRVNRQTNLLYMAMKAEAWKKRAAMGFPEEEEKVNFVK